MAREDRHTLGARPLDSTRTRFRVWAPDRKTVEVAVDTGSGLKRYPLERAGGGYFEGVHPLPAGTRYRYCLDGGECFPDPVSRWQPEGPHGPSEIIDAARFKWTDTGWKGLQPKGQVLYELHVGTFTPEGTYAALEQKLPHLKALGVTALELMPLNTFPGKFNWGYDGVNLFAPAPPYGTPDELRRLVDAAHRVGIGIVLDVVYNHLGPDGNYLAQFAKGYFTKKYKNDWGEPLAFEGEEAKPVRAFFIQNARMWIEEYHLDGLRLDATQNVYDASPRHILTELIDEARAAAPSRQLLIVFENEPQDLRTVTPPSAGGHGGDSLWIDDFHHTARVALTGNAEAYCQDYCGSSQELLSCALHNSLYQGQFYDWQKQRRGTPLLELPAEHAVFYLQNHDQLANTLRGLRLHELAGVDQTRAMTLFFLLLPQTPMLFQGQEFFASAPFLYFVDHKPELVAPVQHGRNDFLCQFKTAEHALRDEGHTVPFGADAFRRSKLDWSEAERHAPVLRLHQDALRLRREDPLLAAQDKELLAGATLNPRALVLRWRGRRLGPNHGDRLLLLNLGPDLKFDPCPEPLLAPPAGRDWRVVLSSQHTRYGGAGARPPCIDGRWSIPGQCALVLSSEEERP